MKYILGIVFVLIIGTLIFIFAPKKSFEVGKPELISESQLDIEIDDQAGSEEEALQDERHTAMLAEYEKLEKARRNLERRLARLKAILWNVMLPSEKSNEITEQMMNGYALLKNKKLLGAFYSPGEISNQLAQVEYIYNNLKEIEEEIRALKEQNKK